MILFDTTNLNIRKLSEILQVSRRSIQNDIEEIQQELEEDDIYLEYKMILSNREVQEIL